MRILAIETSCDETAVCVLEGEGNFSDGAQLKILGNALYSQASLHAPYGGVYPNLAKREHQGNLPALSKAALEESGLFHAARNSVEGESKSLQKIPDEAFRASIREFLSGTAKPEIDLVAVTRGPGLEPALWTGINFAEAVAEAWDVPAIGIDHMEGHIVSALLSEGPEHTLSTKPAELPLLALLISGGHTEFALMREPFTYEEVGATKDDAVGEAFDKVARLLDLPYPGGPKIAEAAARSRARAGEKQGIVFPRPLAHDDTCDFSFSGLKTAVLYKLREMEGLSEEDKEEVAAAFEDAARDIVVLKTRRALERTNPRALAVGGGVSANAEIQGALETLIREEFPETALFFPPPALTGDNAVMIAAAAYLRRAHGAPEVEELSAFGNLKLAK